MHALMDLMPAASAVRVRAALEAMGHQLDAGPFPYQLRGIKGGYTLMTVPEMGEIVGRLAKGAAVERISPAALETLAIVAYRQPVADDRLMTNRPSLQHPRVIDIHDRGHNLNILKPEPLSSSETLPAASNDRPAVKNYPARLITDQIRIHISHTKRT